MGYSGSGATTAQLTSLAADVGAQWGTDLAGLHVPGSVLKEVIAIDLQNPSTVEGSQTFTTAGTRAGTPMTDGVCVALQFVPDRRYRGSRPKAFLPIGVQADLASGQHWGNTFLADVVSDWQNFISDILSNNDSGVALGAQVCIFRTGPPYTVVSNSGKTRSHSVGTPLDPPLVVDVLEVIGSPKVGSQRRRLGKPF